MTFLRWTGRALDFLRRLCLNVLFYSILFALAALWYWAEPASPAVEPGAVLVIDLRGAVVESDPMRSLPTDVRGLLRDGRPATRLSDVVAALERAEADPDVAGVEIRTEELESLGLASARTIGRAVDHFRTATGRPIYAWGGSFTQAQYAAAAHADEISLHPMGTVLFKGLSGTTLYWGGLLERLGVGVNVFKAGAYKSAPEVFTRRAPSEDNLEAQKGWIDDAWRGFSDDLAKARGQMPGALDKYLEGLAPALESGADPAEYAKKAGFVTDLLTSGEFEKKLARRFAEGGDVKRLKRIGHLDYLAARAGTERGAPGVAVVLAQGAVASGRGAGINPDELNERIERAAGALGVRALVLRLSSPGGDAIASESIREKLEAVRGRGIPVVVSMGDVAASGGYWISLGADRIVADPLTLTGSIGVFSVLPDAAGVLEKLDVGAGGYRTGPLADFGSPAHRPDAAERAVLAAGVERTYERFKALAAKSRGRTPEEIEAVAQGRVWTGAQAQRIGLVDRLGDLTDAVKVARQLAGLGDDAPVRYFDAEPSGASALLAGLSARVFAAVMPEAALLGAGAKRGVDALAELGAAGRPLAWTALPEGI